jgi:hypothetical protein
LRLALLFVELRYYRTVNIIFLVAGHTKNAADRLFNLLKQLFRKSQVYTMEQLVGVLNENQYVECLKVGKDDFYKIGDFEDTLYTSGSSSALSGNTKKYQLFTSSDVEPGVLLAKESNSSNDVVRMDMRKGYDDHRSEILSNFDFEELEQLDDCPGIRRIKQVELFSKWRKHVPDKYKSPLYDNPGEEVLKSVKDDRRTKKEYLAMQKSKHEAVEATGKLASKNHQSKFKNRI